MQTKSGAGTVLWQAVVRPVLLFLAALCCLFIPRQAHRWVLCGEYETANLVALAQHLLSMPEQHVTVVVRQPQQPSFVPPQITVVPAASWRGFWATARVRYVCLVGVSRPSNEYAVFGAVLAQIDATISTAQYRSAGPRQLPLWLRRVAQYCKPEVQLYTVSSYVQAQQLRQYTKALPGQVVVTGAPRLATGSPAALPQHRAELLVAVRLPATTARLVLCRVPEQQLEHLQALLQEHAKSFSDNNVCVLLWPDFPAAGPCPVTTGVQVVDPPAYFNPAWYAEFELVVTAQQEIAADAGAVAAAVLWYHTAGAVIPPQLSSAAVTAATLVAEIFATLSQPQRVLKLQRAAAQFAKRFHDVPDGAASRRTITAITALTAAPRRRCEVLLCHTGRQPNLDLQALAEHLKTQAPQLRQVWAVTDERAAVPDGAETILYGAPGWEALQHSAELVLSGSAEATALLGRVRKQRVVAVSQPLFTGAAATAVPQLGMVRARFDVLRPALVAVTQHPTGVNPIVQRIAKTALQLGDTPVLFDLRGSAEVDRAARLSSHSAGWAEPVAVTPLPQNQAAETAAAAPAAPTAPAAVAAAAAAVASANETELTAAAGEKWQRLLPVADPQRLQQALTQQLYAANGIVVDAAGEILLAALLLRLPVAVAATAAADVAAIVPVAALASDTQVDALLRGDSAAATWWQQHDVSAWLRQHFAPLLEDLTPGSCCEKIIAAIAPKHSTQL